MQGGDEKMKIQSVSGAVRMDRKNLWETFQK